MWYKCRSCDCEITVGCLPLASCGLWLLGMFGLAMGVAAAMARWLFGSLGWWSWPTGILAGLILGVPLGLCFIYTSQALEWALAHLKRCPQCQRRRWSWGYTKGFGL